MAGAVMALNAATLRLLADKGLSAADIAEVAEAMEVVKDRTATERKRRQRAREAEQKASSERDMSRVTSRCDTSPEVSPNDIYSNPLPTPSGAEAPSPPLADRVVDAWNKGPGAAGATTAKPLNADRRKALSVRVRENGEAAVFDAIRNLGRSAWHCGGNDRGWRADIGWLLKSPEHFQKALEMEPARTAAPATNNLASLAAQAARYRRPTMTNPSPRGETREARA